MKGEIMFIIELAIAVFLGIFLASIALGALVFVLFTNEKFLKKYFKKVNKIVEDVYYDDNDD